MASHVSTYMSMEKSIKWEGNQFVEEESYKKERKEKKKEKKKKKVKEKKGRERRGKGNQSSVRRSKLIRPRSKVRIFDEGYTPRGRDFSYFGLFSIIRAVGLCLCPKGLFCQISKYGNVALF